MTEEASQEMVMMEKCPFCNYEPCGYEGNREETVCNICSQAQLSIKFKRFFFFFFFPQVVKLLKMFPHPCLVHVLVT